MLGEISANENAKRSLIFQNKESFERSQTYQRQIDSMRKIVEENKEKIQRLNKEIETNRLNCTELLTQDFSTAKDLSHHLEQSQKDLSASISSIKSDSFKSNAANRSELDSLRSTLYSLTSKLSSCKSEHSQFKELFKAMKLSFERRSGLS